MIAIDCQCKQCGVTYKWLPVTHMLCPFGHDNTPVALTATTWKQTLKDRIKKSPIPQHEPFNLSETPYIVMHAYQSKHRMRLTMKTASMELHVCECNLNGVIPIT